MFDVKPDICINPNGGIDIIDQRLCEVGAWKFIDDYLGPRHPRAEYSICDAVRTKTLNLIAGFARLEQGHEQTRDALLHNANFGKGMSSDTVSRILRRLAQEDAYFAMATKGSQNQFIGNQSKQHAKVNQVNLNSQLNSLTLDMAIHLGLLVPGQAYELDADTTIISTKVSDAKTHYMKDGTGYCPLLIMLGGQPVYLEARNGNSNAMFRISEALRQAIDLFESRGLKISFVRIDAAGSTDKVFSYLESKNLKYYIRAHGRTKKSATEFMGWQTSENKSFKYSELIKRVEESSARIIEYYRGDDESKNFGIITNDWEISAQELISNYNRRGTREHRFSDLKAMGWKYMVHHELKFNTVHMHMTMLAHLFLTFSKNWLKDKFNLVKETLEPGTFIRKFIRNAITQWDKGQMVILSLSGGLKVRDGPG